MQGDAGQKGAGQTGPKGSGGDSGELTRLTVGQHVGFAVLVLLKFFTQLKYNLVNRIAFTKISLVVNCIVATIYCASFLFYFKTITYFLKLFYLLV